MRGVLQGLVTIVYLSHHFRQHCRRRVQINEISWIQTEADRLQGSILAEL